VNPYDFNIGDAVEILSETHTHTTESDGQIYGAALIDMYASKGYKMLAITDHDSYRPVRSPRENGGVLYVNTWDWQIFEGGESYQKPAGSYARNTETGLVANGMLTAESTELTRLRHIVIIDSTYAGDTEYTEASALTAIAGTGAVAIMPHPAWPTNYNRATLRNLYQTQSSNHLLGQEVFPGIIDEASLTNSRMIWDWMLTDLMPTRPVWGFAASDTHTIEAYQCYNTVLASALTMEAWKDAVRNGRSFISVEYLRSGEQKAPKITNVIHDAVNRTITITAQNYTTAKWITANNEEIQTGLTLSYAGTTHGITKFARLELENEFGKTYTQPFGFITT
jgi:hypothetical protein